MAIEELKDGRYRLLSQLGEGGMGVVYLAKDTLLGRQVAVKVIRPEVSFYPDKNASSEAARLFLREAKAIADLFHPNILPLHDYGEEQYQNTTLTYMIMPFCPDGSLADWLQQHKLSLQDAAQLISQAATALQYAHDHNVIHLDVKPENFLIHPNPNLPTLLLADFGIAKLRTIPTASSHAIRGTPTAMAPEQWRGNPVPASDQYALAIMAYKLLTGRPPFQGNQEELMYQHLWVLPTAPSTFNSELPAAIDGVLLHALEKVHEERFPSISDFANAFQQTAQNISSPTPPGPAPTGREHPIPPTILAKTHSLWQRLHPHSLRHLFLLVVVFLVVGVSGTGIFVVHNNQIASDNTHATTTAQANVHAQSTATAKAQIADATAVGVASAQEQATADTIGIHNPYGGVLALKVSLHDNSKGIWNETDSCKFIGGIYHVYQANSSYDITCLANVDFSNFTYEVKMIILKGNCGGLTFRATSGTNNDYFFQVCQDGTYSLVTYPTANYLLTPQSSQAIKTGVNQPNLMTVVAYHDHFYFYANRQLIASTQDKTYKDGQIGVDVSSSNTEVAYSDLKVWSW